KKVWKETLNDFLTEGEKQSVPDYSFDTLEKNTNDEIIKRQIPRKLVDCQTQMYSNVIGEKVEINETIPIESQNPIILKKFLDCLENGYIESQDKMDLQTLLDLYFLADTTQV